jgi:hypothetical protein
MRGITFLAAIALVAAVAMTAEAQQPGVDDPFKAPPPRAADPFAAPPTSAAAPKKVEGTAGRARAASSAAARIEQELDKNTELDVVEMPLKDVVQFISDKHGIPILLKMKELANASVSVDSPVTKSFRGITLRSVLNLMLQDLELAYAVRDEVLQITTPEDAQTATEIRIYDCRDLLGMAAPAVEKGAASEAAPGDVRVSGDFGRGRGGVPAPPISEAERRAQRLMAIITTNVDPQTWQANDGTGSVSEYNGLIVVTQTAPSHQKIGQVLEMLRKAAGVAR